MLAVDDYRCVAWAKVVGEESEPGGVESGELKFAQKCGGVDSVEGALDIREKQTDFLVVVEVVKPFAGEECSEVLAAVFGAESVFVGSVSVCAFEVR